ncbi:CoA-transferase subunit beta [Sneathiella sp.]|uniref:CoA-transferase subunit beta n=1 Tax=Sneathiella sp. TaxID=1964365 RepID=UPI00356171E3
MSSKNTSVAWPELAAFVLSKELNDGEIGSPGGARSEIPLAAARLAQLTHAPNLMIITSAAGFVTNNVGRPPAPLFHSTTDYRNIYAGAESVLHFMSIFRTPRDWFFAGGMQVDSYGNLNMTAIGDVKAPKLKGPGGAGLSYAGSVARRYFIYMQQHSRRSFVNKLDYVTAMGYGSGPGEREALGLVGGGPALVFSPLAVMDFCDATKRLRLRSVHPGHTVEEVLDNTGAEMIVPENVPTTALPDNDVLEILRTQVDPSGVLQNLKGSRND